MRKVVLFSHVSLDGFVSGPKGEMDWVNVDEELFNFAKARTDNADTALYGRVTFEMMDAYWPTAAEQASASQHDIEHAKWYNSVEKIVASRTLKQENLKATKRIGENFVAEVKKLKALEGKDILMFGSPAASYELAAENLIDDYWLFINPILLAEGKPLFSALKDRTKLKLCWSKTFDSGVTGLHYQLEPHG